ncbi:MAG: hypothetical protein OEV42_15440 [Deltaproteobacteria bacterium]|nr:hypothetical protein [Deltaproteobacteria bacterium]
MPALVYFTESVSYGASSADIKLPLKKVISESIEDRYRAILELHKLGKRAIPYLINEIDQKGKTFISLKNPKLSNIHPESLKENYCGITYAYIVELILAKKEFKESKDGEILFPLGNYGPNYVYSFGLILDKGSHAPTHEDMKRIKGIYQVWWENHKSSSLDILREKWLNNIRPLSKSSYFWE